jgi:hypothetical protein
VSFRWQKEFFENGVAAFQAQERPHRQVEEKQKRIEYLESFSYPTRFCLWFLPVFSDEFRNRGFLDLVEYPLDSVWRRPSEHRRGWWWIADKPNPAD